MSRETGKATVRRIYSCPMFAKAYFVGDGIDIGAGDDPLSDYQFAFKDMTSCKPWDQGDGDGTYMDAVGDCTYDFVHSSHCLEHLADPYTGLDNWMRILKPQGHLIVVVPDWTMYEKKEWPSRRNGDHKSYFSVSNDTRAIPITALFDHLTQRKFKFKVCRLELLEATFDFRDGYKETDQTGRIGESCIEFVLRKH